MNIPERIAYMRKLLTDIENEFADGGETDSLAEDLTAAATVLEYEIGPAVRERTGHYMLHNRDFDNDGQPNNRREI